MVPQSILTTDRPAVSRIAHEFAFPSAIIGTQRRGAEEKKY
jgi:hypothetical protein